MRDLKDVINRVLGCIPGDQKEIRQRFKTLKSDIFYTAPEMMYQKWIVGSEILFDYLGPEMPTDGWQKEVVDVWMDKIPV